MFSRVKLYDDDMNGIILYMFNKFSDHKRNIMLNAVAAKTTLADSQSL